MLRVGDALLQDLQAAQGGVHLQMVDEKKGMGRHTSMGGTGGRAGSGVGGGGSQ